MNVMFQLMAIAGVLGLLWLTLAGLRRVRIPASSGARLQILQRVTVANGCQLVSVMWEGEELLLATGTPACTVLARKPAGKTGAIEEGRAAWAQS